MVAGTGVVCALVMVLASSYDPLLLHPSLYPLRWPDLPLLPLGVVLLGLVPAFAAPLPVRARAATPVVRERVAA